MKKCETDIVSNWLDNPCPPLDEHAAQRAKERQYNLTKPPGSLGRLEEIAVRLCAMQGTDKPSSEPVFIMQVVSDHGVAIHRTSAFPCEVSGQMLRNFSAGHAPVSVMAKALGACLQVYDIGILQDPGPLPNIHSRRLGSGTADMTCQEAMTQQQLMAGLALGKEIAEDADARGCRFFLGGEMGIGNTTPATAVMCRLLQLDPHDIAGPGSGLDQAGVTHKANVIQQALDQHPQARDSVLDCLRCLAGFDIVVLAAAYLRAAQLGMTLVVDGFIASTAALVASQLKQQVLDWMLFAHRSAEPSHATLLKQMGVSPYLDLGMRLGQASAAVALIPLIQLACTLHNEVATRQEAGLSEPYA